MLVVVFDRDGVAKMYFLRVEVVLQGATYLIVFTDADTIPPPLRIDNFSEVPLIFFQSCVPVESLQTVVRPHSSMPYAWDEPTQAHSVTLMAPGGVLATYDMTYLEKSGDACEGQSLTYENFIYIAFTSTFLNFVCKVGYSALRSDWSISVETVSEGESCVVPNSAAEGSDVRCTPLELESQQLVLDVPPGSSRVVLSHKVPGARGQLWRMTGEGQLQHEGSGPPRDPRSKYTSHPNALVLDIAGPAPQPLQYVHLVLRRKDQRRTSTQTWRFTEEGRLCCMHNNMCVQARDGFFGLRQGEHLVYGVRGNSPCLQVL
uniref:Vacuolar protein sorting-associated protein 13 VPS13 adaptor binding domain-containing protein n=1 Tax=Timema monikensis TaxID=170555 RepID=A0A7R9EN59_9NEOP|nr:unnamed protein product [Timema monikensis]